MVGATDQKTDWNLGETVTWIRTRDHDLVAGMWEMGEFHAIAFPFFDPVFLQRRALPTTSEAAVDTPARLAGISTAEQLPGDPALASQGSSIQGRQGKPTSGDGPEPDRILQEVMRKVQTRKVRMTMISAGKSGAERLPVAAREANELEFRITEDRLAPVIVWSRNRQEAVGTSPSFSRADVVRAWPERLKKTAAVSAAILRHLREISTAERPLTRNEASARFLAEVPNAYPEAFRTAWAQLEPSRKRGRGKHGPRAH